MTCKGPLTETGPLTEPVTIAEAGKKVWLNDGTKGVVVGLDPYAPEYPVVVSVDGDWGQYAPRGRYRYRDPAKDIARVEGRPVEDPKPEPKVGEVWRYRAGGGGQYVITAVTNAGCSDPNYPLTVVYENTRSGNRYSLRAVDWHRLMTCVEKGADKSEGLGRNITQKDVGKYGWARGMNGCRNRCYISGINVFGQYPTGPQEVMGYIKKGGGTLHQAAWMISGRYGPDSGVEHSWDIISIDDTP